MASSPTARALVLPPALERLARRVLQRPALFAFTVLPLALAAGSLAGFAIGRDREAHQTPRLEVIKTALASIEGEYLLAIGDSHIAQWREATLCGLPLVNAGIPGATTSDYAAIMTSFPLPRPPRAIIVTVGTNDAHTKRFRDPDDAQERFQTGFRRLLVSLSHKTQLVMLTDVPTIATDVAGFSERARQRIAASAAAECAAVPACTMTGAFNAVKPGGDGIHFDDYATIYRSLVPSLCSRLGQRDP